MSWEGRSGPTDKHVYEALLELAATFGQIAKKGVVVAADMRRLALEAGTTLKTVHASLKRLADKEARKLIRLSKKGTSKRAHAYLLKYPLRRA